MNAVFELSEVTVERSGQTILDHLNWTVTEGEHWAVLGPNGAGKTTLAKVLTGRERLTGGELEVLGEPISDLPVNELARMIGLSSAALSAKFAARITALDVVISAAHGLTKRFQETYEEMDFQRANDLLAAFGVSHLAERQFSTLSEGEKQRVQIARAFMADPQALILDEPGAGLDLGARENLMLALSELAGDRRSPAMVVITHHIEEIAAGFTHALILKSGQAIAAGPIAEVLNSQNLSTAFGLELEVSQVDGRFSARGKR
ncbi:iron ABC transporter ATP-binding protein [Boudabousia liubingyangii]|uniref:Iron ABC transporter ATP-binding protein n=1 Tax=Boudabousia liubingyangii TaxID=1921764 RepID=A0A1Q5PP25_9ACTO|nr:ATP-binding cassette domain-containing protein [Boudabousia liubingyangii]OKL47807.1 iron ABC transporter ATP-binding protein [Boudabousia liubingyangii]OKL49190.1 iron ABC transporter ATP-binding protein [Boudabousia liubingyangii]